MLYLYAKQHYIDLYDLHTIDECLDTINTYKKIYSEKQNDEQIKTIPIKEKGKTLNYMLASHLFFIKAELYKSKQSTIEKWMNNDRIKQDKYDQTPAPDQVLCEKCKSEMTSSYKILHSFTDEPMRMLFFFDCSSCKHRCGVYDDGSYLDPKPQQCPKCKSELTTSSIHNEKDKVITWITKCNSCKYEQIEVDDYKAKEIENEKKDANNKTLLKKYRSEFCLDGKTGQEYLETVEAMEYAPIARNEEMEKYDNPIYDKISAIKKLNIAQLESLLIQILEKENYSKLSFEKPDIGQFIILTFSFQDMKASRSSKSDYEVKKLIEKELEPTNWRLMHEPLSNRLGFITGRLKGYEHETDMIKLFGNIKPKHISNIDPNKKAKLESNKYVQLARMIGKLDATDNIRKKRLKLEPKGFILVSESGWYSCGICSRTHESKEIWFNVDGIRCLDCHRNSIERVIPSLNDKYEHTQWFENYYLTSEYGIHPSTIGKLRREGLLKGRDLKNTNGSIYFTVYLIEENKELLKKYLRNGIKSKPVITNKGDSFEL